MAKNPYTLLGLKKGASEAEIRKAYRNLAKKLHPDVNPGNAKAEEKFKEVTAAYNLLSDKDLRARYDSGKVDASGQQQNPFGGFGRGAGGGSPFQTGFGGQDDMSDLFSSLFGMNMNGMRSNVRQQMQPRKGADVRYKLKISLSDVILGGTKTLGPDLKVKIPIGIQDGQTLRLRGKGQAGTHGGPKGDVKVDITVLSHKNLKRDGRNLALTLPVSLREALGGAKVKFNMPQGAVQLMIPPGTNSGKKMRLKGKGIDGGDLVVTIRITLLPSEIEAKTMVIEALPDEHGDTLRKSLI